MVREVFASVRSRWLLACTSACVFGVVYMLVLVFERPGLGTGHLFYLAIMLLAMATGPSTGAVGGLLAAALYSVGVVGNPHLPPASLVTLATTIRLVTFVVVGFAFGWFATRNRAALLELKDLAERDHLTGLLNSRGFEEALATRMTTGRAFGLLYGDIDYLKRINDANGHAEGDRAIRRAAVLLQDSVCSGDVVARVGGDEFAALVSTRSENEAWELVQQLENALHNQGADITLGWAVYPTEATDALGLGRLADKRLYERKTLKPNRPALRLATAD